MTLEELFHIQSDYHKLKSLYIELSELENFNPFKKNIMSDTPKSGEGKNITEWYLEEKERVEKEIICYKKKMQQDRKELEEYIKNIPFPECEIIRYRVINHLGWFEIGELMGMDRRTAARKFYNYINLPTMPVNKC